MLSGWSDWSTCDARCGTGVKQRRRTIVVRPQNGGRQCGQPLVEKTVCEGTGCKQPRAPSDRLDAAKGDVLNYNTNFHVFAKAICTFARVIIGLQLIIRKEGCGFSLFI